METSTQQSDTSEPREPTHPLDPLAGWEMRRALEVVRAEGGLPDGCRVADVALWEPSKEDVAAFRPGTPVPRKALVVALDPAAGMVTEAVVDLREGVVRSRTEVPGSRAS